jgi:hypothetical protein
MGVVKITAGSSILLAAIDFRIYVLEFGLKAAHAPVKMRDIF